MLWYDKQSMKTNTNGICHENHHLSQEKGHLQLDPAHIFTVLVKDKTSLPAQVTGSADLPLSDLVHLLNEFS